MAIEAPCALLPSRQTQPTIITLRRTETKRAQQMVIVGGFLWRRLGTNRLITSINNDQYDFVSQSFRKRLMLNDKMQWAL